MQSSGIGIEACCVSYTSHQNVLHGSCLTPRHAAGGPVRQASMSQARIARHEVTARRHSKVKTVHRSTAQEAKATGTTRSGTLSDITKQAPVST